MKQALTAFFSGLVFSAGLVLGGMTLPSNIIGFLDITGTWKPALMFVMFGAILIYFFGFRLVMRRQRPIFDSEFHVPLRGLITPKLIFGSAVFGVGWALSGYCPGPAIVSVGAGSFGAAVFVGFMCIGMLVYQVGFSRD